MAVRIIYTINLLGPTSALIRISEVVELDGIRKKWYDFLYVP